MRPRPSDSQVADQGEREISAKTVEACRRGDRDAFRTVYECYKDRVYSISLHFFHGDVAMASDVTQQVFLKLMTSFGQFRGDAELSTWLYRLVVNACLDVSRRRKSEALVEPNESGPEQFIAPGSPEEDYARVEREQSVRRAIGTLPPKFRVAVLLRYFDDLSYEQMATALNCSMGTVASRLSRAHRALAARLKDVIDRRD